MMSSITDRALKIGLLALLVAVAQAAITAMIPPETPFKVRVLNQYLVEGKEIIYFGDSSVRHVDPRDRDRRTVAQLLQARIPGGSVGDVLGSGYQLDVYKEYVNYMIASGARPKLVIVPINLRSFAREWDLNPMYQFEDVKLYLALARDPWQLMFYRPLSVFRDMQPIDEIDYRNLDVFDGETVVGKLRDFDVAHERRYSREKMRRAMILRYMYALHPEHRKVRAMVDTARILAAHGIPFVFYVPPIDYETGVRHVGPRFTDRVRLNLELLRAQLRGAGDLLDLAMTVPARDFVDHVYPIEHVNEKGRQLVALELHRFIQRNVAHLVDHGALAAGGAGADGSGGTRPEWKDPRGRR
jgi:hypothetical protein